MPAGAHPPHPTNTSGACQRPASACVPAATRSRHPTPAPSGATLELARQRKPRPRMQEARAVTCAGAARFEGSAGGSLGAACAPLPTAQAGPGSTSVPAKPHALQRTSTQFVRRTGGQRLRSAIPALSTAQARSTAARRGAADPAASPGSAQSHRAGAGPLQHPSGCHFHPGRPSSPPATPPPSPFPPPCSLYTTWKPSCAPNLPPSPTPPRKQSKITVPWRQRTSTNRTALTVQDVHAQRGPRQAQQAQLQAL